MLREVTMTLQYIVGEFSELVGMLEPAPGERLADAVHTLRRQVECSPLAAFTELAAQAANLADMICWAALEEGDTAGFARRSAAAALFHEFAVSANLLP
jgi:hypothetical protein